MKQRFIVLLLIGLACCKAKENVITPPVKLIINVKDTNNSLLTFPVPVYLFDNSANYLSAVPYYTGANAIATDTTVNGICTFSNLDPTKHYYVYSHYRNYASVPNNGGIYYIDYDNSDNAKVTSIVLDSVANASPQVTGVIYMKPADALISFWTSNENTDALPIQVIVDNNVYDTIIAPFAGSSPSYGSAGVFTSHIKAGQKHSYYASSANCSGCTWEATTDSIRGGGFYYYELKPCNTGTVIFWTDPSNSSFLPIDIVASDDSTVLATITTTSSIAPDLSSVDASAKRVDQAQSYVYGVKSRNGKCRSEVQYIISAGQCQTVQISTCGE